jgi:hypothetical protein
MVMAVSSGQIEIAMVPMPVSLADADADGANLNSDVLCDDHFAAAQRASKCRHRGLADNSWQRLRHPKTLNCHPTHGRASSAA